MPMKRKGRVNPRSLAQTLMTPEEEVISDPGALLNAAGAQPGGPLPGTPGADLPVDGGGEGMTTAQILAGAIPSSQWQRGKSAEEMNPLYAAYPHLGQNLVDQERWTQFAGAPYGMETGMYNGWNLQDRPSVYEYQAMIDRPGASSAPQMMGPGINVQQNMAMANAILEAARSEWEKELASRDKAKETPKKKDKAEA